MDAIFTLSELSALMPYLIEEGKTADTWVFEAPMGAGKTTLIHALATYCGVQQTVSSPTYALVNEYTTAEDKTIYHMDWYRLKDEEEAANAGIEELVNSYWCWIEWPEKAIGILPDDVFIIRIVVVNETTRRIITELSHHSFIPSYL